MVIVDADHPDIVQLSGSRDWRLPALVFRLDPSRALDPPRSAASRSGSLAPSRRATSGRISGMRPWPAPMPAGRRAQSVCAPQLPSSLQCGRRASGPMPCLRDGAILLGLRHGRAVPQNCYDLAERAGRRAGRLGLRGFSAIPPARVSAN
jgi:hypothetical protein